MVSFGGIRWPAMGFLILASLVGASPAHAVFPGTNGKITFTSTRDGNSEIYVMSAVGGSQTRLTNNPAADFQSRWSPDGTRLVFTSNRDGNFEIYAMNADGSGQTRLTSNAATDQWPAWSPDGARIVFQSLRDGNLEIYVMNADGSNQTRLTINVASDSQPPGRPTVPASRLPVPATVATTRCT